MENIQELFEQMCAVNVQFIYRNHFDVLGLAESELVAMVMMCIDVVHCQTCCRSMAIFTACYHLKCWSSAAKQHR